MGLRSQRRSGAGEDDGEEELRGQGVLRGVGGQVYVGELLSGSLSGGEGGRRHTLAHSAILSRSNSLRNDPSAAFPSFLVCDKRLISSFQKFKNAIFFETWPRVHMYICRYI